MHQVVSCEISTITDVAWQSRSCLLSRSCLWGMIKSGVYESKVVSLGEKEHSLCYSIPQLCVFLKTLADGWLWFGIKIRLNLASTFLLADVFPVIAQIIAAKKKWQTDVWFFFVWSCKERKKEMLLGVSCSIHCWSNLLSKQTGIYRVGNNSELPDCIFARICAH